MDRGGNANLGGEGWEFTETGFDEDVVVAALTFSAYSLSAAIGVEMDAVGVRMC